MPFTFTDMLGREVVLQQQPQRIISLVPSQTELLYALGAGEQVVGQTVFCIHPREGFEQTTKVGGTKKVKYDVIDTLQPDLIICNKEENTLEIVNTLSAKYPVWISDIFTLQDNSEMILKLGNIVNRLPRAMAIVKEIEKNFSYLTFKERRSCLYLIWKDPYMAPAKHTFIDHLLHHAGFDNVLKDRQRYPQLSDEELRSLNPEVVMLSSEPYPFKETHLEALRQIFPRATVQLVDGEMFSWYGSRLIQAPEYFATLQSTQ